MEFITLYWWRILLSIVISYLLGSFSFAVIFTKLSKNEDVRTMGSGNAGFTNVLRSVGVVPAIFTFIFDCLKGVIAILLTAYIFNLQFDSAAISELTNTVRFEYLTYGKYLAAVFCVFGHSFPIFFGFKGGKGITTMAGILLILDWKFLALVLGTWIIFFVMTKIISVGSVMAAATISVWNFVVTYFFHYKSALDAPAVKRLSYSLVELDEPLKVRYVVVTSCIIFFIAVFVLIMHRENIKRLIRGEEKKIKAKKN